MKLIRAHIGLIKYILQEIKNKKTFKDFVKFGIEIIKSYMKFWVQYFIHLGIMFNKDYRKQQKKYKKYMEVKADLQKALKILKYIDNKMKKSGLSRQKIRQFWRDFYKSGQVRKEMFDDLLKDMK